MAILTVCAVLYVLVQVGVALRQYLLVKKITDLVNRINNRTLPKVEATVDALHGGIDDASDVLCRRIEDLDGELQAMTESLRTFFTDVRDLLEQLINGTVGSAGSRLVSNLITGWARRYFEIEDPSESEEEH